MPWFGMSYCTPYATDPFGVPAGDRFDPHVAAMLSTERQAFTAPKPWTVPGWMLKAVAPYAASIAVRTSMRVSNAKAKRELGCTPSMPTYRQGVTTLGDRYGRADFGSLRKRILLRAWGTATRSAREPGYPYLALDWSPYTGTPLAASISDALSYVPMLRFPKRAGRGFVRRPEISGMLWSLAAERRLPCTS